MATESIAGHRVRKPKEHLLFSSLASAHKAKALAVFINAERLNRPGSPIWNAEENVVPLLLLALIPVFLMFVASLIVGLATMMVGIVIYFLVVRPWILLRVQRRAMALAMESARNWEVLWKKGGLTLALSSPQTKKVRCVSPKGDWQGFIMSYFPPQKVDGAELYESVFKPIEEDDADAESCPT